MKELKDHHYRKKGRKGKISFAFVFFPSNQSPWTGLPLKFLSLLQQFPGQKVSEITTERLCWCRAASLVTSIFKGLTRLSKPLSNTSCGIPAVVLRRRREEDEKVVLLHTARQTAANFWMMSLNCLSLAVVNEGRKNSTSPRNAWPRISQACSNQRQCICQQHSHVRKGQVCWQR